jgi:hypothetical protein
VQGGRLQNVYLPHTSFQVPIQGNYQLSQWDSQPKINDINTVYHEFLQWIFSIR